MIAFLTSSTALPDTDLLNPANHFIEELRNCFPSSCRCLFICSDPWHSQATDHFAYNVKTSFEGEDFSFESFEILDGRNEEEAEQLVENSNLIILAGGHVPTQNAFFQKIHLKDLLKDYDGILIGISAGSMNCAKTVYAQPEETGEAVDPSYEKFIEGLGITETMILPHYQSVKDDLLDGMRLFEDITYGDSYGHVFYAIPDGTYLYIEEDKEELRGEAYRIKDGKMEIFCKENETVRMR